MDISDENYVSLMKNRNEEALAYFIEKDGWIIKSIINKSSVLSSEEKKECMNDTFLTIWQRIVSYDESRASFSTWAAGVSRYCILNYLKKRSKLKMLSLEKIMGTGFTGVSEDRYLAEEKQEFYTLLKDLDEKDREIFMKLFWEEKDYGQICREMNMKKEVLYNRISRSRKKLRMSLKGKEGI